jgi:hypothetical protein
LSGPRNAGTRVLQRLCPFIAALAIWTQACAAQVSAVGDGYASLIDLSFLNAAERPAGKHGFLRAVGDKLVFQDGTSVRFWGTNLTAFAVVGTSRKAVRQQAHFLSALGFNLVRIQHLDADWLDPNIFGGPRAPDTEHLDPGVLESLDWWIKCLEDEGIYVWLDLQQDRRFRAADGIDAFSEISKGKPTAELQGYAYVNPSIQKAMQRFNGAFVNHLNPFTGHRYAEDPGIVAMLITNENDVTNHFGNRLLPDKRVPWHNARYMRLSGAFADAWGLSRDKTWRSWEPGPSMLFLNDLEHRFDADMIAGLREQGVKMPIIPTSMWGNDPLSSLPVLTVGDLIDAHAYGRVGELQRNPLREPNMMDWLAAAQVSGKPLSVSEWNVEPFPVPDRGTVPLYIAASASLQGWRAVMQYAYSQLPLDQPGEAGNWEGHNDPALMAAMPAAALMYRRGDVREANTTYAFAPSADQLFNQFISPKTSVALRTAAEKGRLLIVLPKTIQLPWLQPNRIPAEAKVITDPKQSVVARDATEAISDTRELKRNWGHGTYTINTPRTQAAMGWIGRKHIQLADVELALSTPNATVAVQSLDEKAIRESRQILISLGAGAIPSSPNRLPFRAERVGGHIAIRAPNGLKVYVARQSNVTMSPHERGNEVINDGHSAVSATYRDGRYVIDLGRGPATHWLVLR